LPKGWSACHRPDDLVRHRATRIVLLIGVDVREERLRRRVAEDDDGAAVLDLRLGEEPPE